MTTVSLANLKGGVGKSTLTMILSEFLSFHFGRKVLVIDMDSQANLSTMMLRGADIDTQRSAGRTIYHFFKEVLNGRSPSITDFIAEPPLRVSNIAGGGRGRFSDGDGRFEGLRMVASCPDFSQLDQDLLDLWRQGMPYPEGLDFCLACGLRDCADRFDYVLIDCPPGLTVFTSTALIASDYFVSPVVPEPLAIRGVDLLQKRVAELKQVSGDPSVECKVQYAGAILNLVQPYRKTHQKYGELIYGLRQPSESDDPVTMLEPFHWYVPFCETLRRVSDFEEIEARGKEPMYQCLDDKYRSAYLNSRPGGTEAYWRGEGEKYLLPNRLRDLTEEFMEKCPC